MQDGAVAQNEVKKFNMTFYSQMETLCGLCSNNGKSLYVLKDSLNDYDPHINSLLNSSVEKGGVKVVSDFPKLGQPISLVLRNSKGLEYVSVDECVGNFVDTIDKYKENLVGVLAPKYGTGAYKMDDLFLPKSEGKREPNPCF